MHNFFDDIDWQDRIERLNGNRVALYGAGKYGENALKNIKKYLPQLEISCFIDDDKIRNNKDIEGLQILSLDEAITQYSNLSILITNYYVSSVIEKIESQGFDISKVFFWSELLIEDIDCTYLIENKDNLHKAYFLLEDYLSKMIFRGMIEARFSKNIDLLSVTCELDQYFPADIFKLNEEEVFIDAGAFEGDTIDAFLTHTNQRYKFIYAFEPDKSNYEKLISHNNMVNCKIYNAGLYCENRKISFAANKGGSSKIGSDGMDSVRVLRFDDLELPEKDITFVKMDVEGSELMALQGMAETIKKNKPKLAISIYHKFEDIWEIPLFIKSIVPEYRLYIRNYTIYLDEIVLYAIV